jgi:hypothetical protein
MNTGYNVDQNNIIINYIDNYRQPTESVCLLSLNIRHFYISCPLQNTLLVVKMKMTLFDRVLIAMFWVFAFTALVFEPLYYFGCDWNYDNCKVSSFKLVFWVGEIWAIYNQWDPMFWHLPMWLRVMCAIEVLIFGPLYALTAYGLQHRSKWLPHVALPFAGALFYSTIVYFAMEFIENLPGTNHMMVFLVNIPWSIFPVLLCVRIYQLYDIYPLRVASLKDDKVK